MTRLRFAVRGIVKLLSRFFLGRYLATHSLIGILNLAIFGLLVTFGMHDFVAVFIGHCVHVAIAFFTDRDIVWGSKDTPRHKMYCYWVVEAISFASIFLVMHLCGVLLGMDEWRLPVWGGHHWEEWGSFVSRCIAALVSLAISIAGNQKFVFND